MRHVDALRIFVVSLLAAAGPPAARAQVDLLADRVYPTATQARAIVALRLDGDALPDVVVGETNGVTRMLSTGAGKLAPLPELFVGEARQLLVADLRADGKDDVVTLSTNGGTIRVLISDGTGALTLATTIDGGGDTLGLAAGDVNGDGKVDIVAANEDNDTVGVLLGDGFGGLSPAVKFPVGNSIPFPAEPHGVAIGDVNEDGKPDIVSANYHYPSSLSVLLGNGAGAFAPPVNMQMGSVSFWGGSEVALVDLNHDGHLDIASDGSVRLGDGTGAFAAPLPSVGTSQFVDFDGDGNLDVLMGSGKLYVILGNGQGGTLSTTGYASGSNTVDAAVADFDADGDLDAAVLDYDYSGSSYWSDVHVLRNDGSAAFPPPAYETLPTQGSVSQRMAIADLDDDGARDLVALNKFSSDLSVLRGDGAAGFLPPVLFPVGTMYALDLALADIDGDGDEDAAVLLEGALSPDSVTVMLGDGAGAFAALPPLTLGGQAVAIALGDLDGDGLADLVTGGDYTTDTLTVRLGTGAGSFGPPWTMTLFYPCCNGGADRLQVIDLDADGHRDVLIGRTSGGFSVCLGNGTGTLGPPTHYVGLGESVVAADLDADGDLDVVGRDVSGVVGVMLAVPGGYAPAVKFPPFVGVPAVGDLDADGDPDITVLDNASSNATCLLNDGEGNFTLHGTFRAGGRPIKGFIEDLDVNGYGDVVALCTHSQEAFPEHVTVLRGQSSSPWLGLGHSLAGTQGAPLLTGFGKLLPNTPITLKIAQALPLGSAVLALGTPAIDAPFKGGVFVPYPSVLIFGLPLNAGGAFAGSGTWYSNLPSGFSIYFQAWIPDPAGPAGYAATNGLRGTTP